MGLGLYEQMEKVIRLLLVPVDSGFQVASPSVGIGEKDLPRRLSAHFPPLVKGMVPVESSNTPQSSPGLGPARCRFKDIKDPVSACCLRFF